MNKQHDVLRAFVWIAWCLILAEAVAKYIWHGEEPTNIAVMLFIFFGVLCLTYKIKQ